MVELTRHSSARPQVLRVDALSAPHWLSALFAGHGPQVLNTGSDTRLERTDAAGLCHLRVEVPHADIMAPLAFQRRVVEAYGLLERELGTGFHPIRFWNFVPQIHRRLACGMDRYEVFNAGRFAAYAHWYGGAEFGDRMIAASAVDPRQASFVVSVLASTHPGRGFENPRQQAAYQYSRRYGPMPPCFARATLLNGTSPDAIRHALLIAGTASVLGEDTVHVQDLDAQLDETIANLNEVAKIAAQTSDGHGLYRELRIYLVDATQAERVAQRFAAAFPTLEWIEWMPADLCRSDLLIEVEGFAKTQPA